MGEIAFDGRRSGSQFRAEHSGVDGECFASTSEGTDENQHVKPVALKSNRTWPGGWHTAKPAKTEGRTSSTFLNRWTRLASWPSSSSSTSAGTSRSSQIERGV